ncbi:uncharacterized protein FFNC_10211 [Fusarium fujikuroi]|nr:uncharacterized protein FFNC_10211 [Fusarium fujikuroi]
MRPFTNSFLTVLLVASRALVTCVEGHEEIIGPNYVVKHLCDYYRGGTLYKEIGSAQDCATLAMNVSAIASTYHIDKKQCLVADMEGEKEGKISGTIFMVKVEDEPFPRGPNDRDPLPTTCEEDKNLCLAREASL